MGHKTLITFTHGIGDFNESLPEKVDLGHKLVKLYENSLEEAADPLHPDVTRFAFIPYEKELEQLPTTMAVTMAARMASQYYLGTPYAGHLLADYGTDIMQYCLRRKVRDAVMVTVARQLAAKVFVHSPDQLVALFHSLGTLVGIRLMSALMEVEHGPGPILKKFEGTAEGKLLLEDLTAIRESVHLIDFVLLGSPAFSRRMKIMKGLIKRITLRESPVDKLAERLEDKDGIDVINVYSTSLIRDPLAGPSGVFPDVPGDGLGHRDIIGHFNTWLSDLEEDTDGPE